MFVRLVSLGACVKLFTLFKSYVLFCYIGCFLNVQTLLSNVRCCFDFRMLGINCFDCTAWVLLFRFHIIFLAARF